MSVPSHITGRGTALRTDPLPTVEDIARNARRLRVGGHNTAAWIIERLAFEVSLPSDDH